MTFETFGKAYRFRNGMTIFRANIFTKNNLGEVITKTGFVVFNKRGECATRTFNTFDDARAFVLA